MAIMLELVRRVRQLNAYELQLHSDTRGARMSDRGPILECRKLWRQRDCAQKTCRPETWVVIGPRGPGDATPVPRFTLPGNGFRLSALISQVINRARLSYLAPRDPSHVSQPTSSHHDNHSPTPSTNTAG